MFAEVDKHKQDFAGGKIITPFKVGKVAEIVDGPAKGQIGLILENDDAMQFAVIQLEMFGKKTPTEIEHKYLKIKE